MDDSQPDILCELSDRIQHQFGIQRQIHLLLENDHNAAHYLRRDTSNHPKWYVAQWNDDIHHALHVLLTNETSGYYMDYADQPLHHLARCLSEGFAYQGEDSPYRNNQPRGEASAQLPPSAFVSFLQNHDQVGNRAFGERINSLTGPQKLRAVISLLLLAPAPPLLFMGQEWGCQQPFPFFCDFGSELADKVVSGRRDEFARFPEFSDPAVRLRIPNPMKPQTFAQAKLDWQACEAPEHKQWLELHCQLLALRHQQLVPRLHGMSGNQPPCTVVAERLLSGRWRLGDGSELSLLANLSDVPFKDIEPPAGQLLFTTHTNTPATSLAAWSVSWYLDAKSSQA